MRITYILANQRAAVLRARGIANVEQIDHVVVQSVVLPLPISYVPPNRLRLGGTHQVEIEKIEEAFAEIVPGLAARLLDA